VELPNVVALFTAVAFGLPFTIRLCLSLLALCCCRFESDEKLLIITNLSDGVKVLNHLKGLQVALSKSRKAFILEGLWALLGGSIMLILMFIVTDPMAGLWIFMVAFSAGVLLKDSITDYFAFLGKSVHLHAVISDLEQLLQQYIIVVYE